MGAGITALILYIFDEELQPVVDKSKSFLVGIIGKNAETFNAGANVSYADFDSLNLIFSLPNSALLNIKAAKMPCKNKIIRCFRNRCTSAVQIC